ncbi:MAG: BtpA/SgcQ family protein [Armatimonadota bacterium]
MSLYSQLFAVDRPLIGMVHLLPLPGAPRWAGSMDRVIERALADAAALEAAGFDGVLVENYNDVPFYPDRVPPETLAAVSVCVREVVRSVGLPVGVNLLRNDGEGAVAVAAAAGARFVRINVHTGVMAADQGLLTGRAHETLRLRARLGADVAIFADLWVKHAVPLGGGTPEQAAEDLYRRGLADALIVTGTGTGKQTDLSRVDLARRAVPDAPVLVGSGVRPETVAEVLAVANGAIVGTALSHQGAAGSGIDPERARAFAAAIRAQG